MTEIISKREKYSNLELLEIKKSNNIYTIEEIRKKLYNIFEKYDVKKAYIFGSYARNSATKDSDVDILISRGNFKGSNDFVNFTFELVYILKKEVDIITEENYNKKTNKNFFVSLKPLNE